MGYCDLCNISIGNGAKRYSSFEVKSAVRAGLRPSGMADDLADVFGMSQDEMHADWVQMVMSDTTDWALCSPCSSKADLFLGKTTSSSGKKPKDITPAPIERKLNIELSKSVTAKVPLLWARDGATTQAKQNLVNSSELRQKLDEAALLLDKKILGSENAMGAMGCLSLIVGAGIGFYLGYLITLRSDNNFSVGWSVLGAVIGAVVLFVVLTFIFSVLNPGLEGVKKAIQKICNETNSSKSDLLEYLPIRLQNAPDVLEFLDEQALKKGMEKRRAEIATLITTSLKQTQYVNKDAISKTISEGKETPLEHLITLSNLENETLRIQLVSAVGEAIATERQNLISERLRRASNIMLNNIGATNDVNVILQHSIALANTQMTAQFARFYLIYGLFSVALLPFLKGWRWQDAIDTIMGWSSELHPSIGLAVFLQGYWQDNPESEVTPEIMASRVMAWVYVDPKKWETIKHLFEDTTIHQLGMKDGKVDSKALKQPWRKFAAEVSRQATILLPREEHKNSAKTVKEYCLKV